MLLQVASSFWSLPIVLSCFVSFGVFEHCYVCEIFGISENTVSLSALQNPPGQGKSYTR